MKKNYKEAYKIWREKIIRLNNHINSLKEWDDYAEAYQREYDWLLKQEPRKGDYNDKQNITK